MLVLLPIEAFEYDCHSLDDCVRWQCCSCSSVFRVVLAACDCCRSTAYSWWRSRRCANTLPRSLPVWPFICVDFYGNRMDAVCVICAASKWHELNAYRNTTNRIICVVSKCQNVSLLASFRYLFASFLYSWSVSEKTGFFRSVSEIEYRTLLSGGTIVTTQMHGNQEGKVLWQSVLEKRRDNAQVIMDLSLRTWDTWDEINFWKHCSLLHIMPTTTETTAKYVMPRSASAGVAWRAESPVLEEISTNNRMAQDDKLKACKCNWHRILSEGFIITGKTITWLFDQYWLAFLALCENHSTWKAGFEIQR